MQVKHHEMLGKHCETKTLEAPMTATIGTTITALSSVISVLGVAFLTILVIAVLVKLCRCVPDLLMFVISVVLPDLLGEWTPGECLQC